MSELLPCPFPMEQKPVIEKIGNCYEINCIEVRRGIYIKVVVRVREDIGDEKMLTEIWNTRHYPPEVQQAVERMEPREIVKTNFGTFDLVSCSGCGHVVSINAKFCSECGQNLDWRE